MSNIKNYVNYLEKINNSEIQHYPFPHIIIDNFLEDKLYNDIINYLNNNDLFKDHNYNIINLWH